MDYKDTLNLPKTDFPMKAGLVQREPEFLAKWEKDRLYDKIQAARKSSKEHFVLHDGPPFANGDVHMGTALNKILKDFIVKFKTMSGCWAPYVPGWDCHGLPIEYKVVKSDANLTPLQVRQKSEEFARKYIDIQRSQFKRLGVLGDWEKPYLTLDKKYEADVLRLFADIVAKGLVYQGKKPVYWSTGCQTALAEAEVEYAEKDSPAVYVKFEVVGQPGTFVVIWTTTPWTLPANLAVAINPRLPYGYYQIGSDQVILCESLPAKAYEFIKAQKVQGPALDSKGLLSLKLKHPFLNREVPVLAGDFVASDTGTGCVHIAPGHGQDDYNIAKHLGLLSPVDDNGKFTAEVGVPDLVGKYVFAANKDVIELLRSKSMLVAEETIHHSYPHCWRSKTPVIFRAIEQWFIRVEDIKPQALNAISKVNWVPDWGQNRIRGTVESRSDWCISRQRSWGIPLPILYKANKEPILDKALICKLADVVEARGSNVWFELSATELAKELGLNEEGVTKRNDTLDVWIDSGSSHRAVLRRHLELKFPADVYFEGSDQHRGWFQSSLLTSVATNDGQAPYSTVITNGFLVDLDGKKISKSSTYEKPKDADTFVKKYGADIVRLWVSSQNYQNDVPLSEEIFTRINDTYRSVRNTLRILLANLHDFDPARDRIDLSKVPAALNELSIDAWILSRLQGLITTVLKAYQDYDFTKVYHSINTFCSVEVSSLYVDITKDRMYCDAPDSQRRRATQTVMHEVASALCRLLAPILSYTAEEAWAFISRSSESVHLQLMPQPNPKLQNAELEQLFDRILALRALAAGELEKARQEKKIGKSIDARVLLEIGNAKEKELFSGKEAVLAELFIVSQIELKDASADRATVVSPVGKKCARSWRWDESVGQNPEFPDLSARDAAAVKSYLEKAKNQSKNLVS